MTTPLYAVDILFSRLVAKKDQTVRVQRCDRRARHVPAVWQTSLGSTG